MKCLFNFGLAGLLNGLKQLLQPLSSQKKLNDGLHSTSDDQLDWSMDCEPHPPPLSSQKMKCLFLDYVQLLMISQAGRWLKPHCHLISSQKHEILVFGLHSKADDRPGWSMDLNPIYHLSPAKKMKCSFLDYVQLLMIGWAGWWTRTPSVTPLQPKEWNACFWITFNFWWLARLVNGLEPHLPPLSSHKKWNAHFWITFNFWWLARLVDGLEPHLPPLSSQKHEMLIFGLCSTSDDSAGLVDGLKPHLSPLSIQKNEMLVFGLHSTSDDWPGWSMDSNPICHPSPAIKMKCSFLDYIQLLMFSRPGRWIWTPSATPLQPKTWNAHFWITFNFWWLAGLVDGLEPCVPPLCRQKNEMLIFRLHSTSDDWPGWSMDSNPICHPSPAKKMKCSFLDYVQLLMIRLGWSIDLNPICHLSPAKKMKCSFLDYVQLLMIGRAGRWTWALCVTSLQPKKWNAHFWIMFNFWWLAGLVDGLKPHLPPLSSQKNEMLVFGLPSTSDDWPGWSMDSNPIYHFSPAKKMKCSFLDYVQLLMIGQGWSMDLSPVCDLSAAKKMKCSFLGYVQLLMIGRAGRWTRTPSATPLQPKTWNAHFKIMFNFWRLAGLVDGLKPNLPPLSSQKNEMLVFGLPSTSDDWPGWSMDSNPICHPSPAKNMKCSFLDYIQLLMFNRPGRWIWTPSATPLHPKTWNAHFWITFNFRWLARLVNGLKPHLPPLSSEKMKCLFLDYLQLLMIGRAGRWTWTPSTTSLQPKNEMLIFGLHSTSDDWPGWSMDSNPICHPSPDKKMKCSFLDYIQLLMIGQLVHGLEPHLPPLSSQKNEMLIFGLRSTSDDQEGWLIDSNPICHPFPAKKWNAHFWIAFNFWWSGGLVDRLKPHLPPLSSDKNEMLIFWITFNFWWLAGLVNGLKCHPPPLSSYKHEMLVFGLHSTSDDWPRWLMHSNPICHLSPAKKMKCSFLDYIQLLMIDQAGWWTWTPSTTSLQPQKWNAHFWIMFNFWWSARLVDGLKPHLPPISSQKHEILVFGLHSTSDDQPGWSMDSNSICNPYPAKKNEMLIFGLHSTSDDQLDWSMDSNAIHHPSPAKNMKCLFLDYIQLLMICQAGRCTRTPFATSLQPKKWNAHFWITFKGWWSARLVDGLEPHLPPPSSQKNEMLIFWIMFNFWWLARLVDGLKPHLQPLSSQKKLNAHFWITFNFWWLLGLINWLKPHPPPLSTQKNEMPIFTLHSNSDDKPGWSMDSNSICHASPAKKIQCSFLEYVQLLMIGQASWWTQTPSATPLQPKNEIPHFWNTFHFWWLARLVDGLEPHLPPLSSQKKLNAHSKIMFNFWRLAGLVDGLKPHLSPLSSQKNEMLVFGLPSTSDDSARPGRCTRTPSATPLQP